MKQPNVNSTKDFSELNTLINKLWMQRSGNSDTDPIGNNFGMLVSHPRCWWHFWNQTEYNSYAKLNSIMITFYSSVTIRSFQWLMTQQWCSRTSERRDFSWFFNELYGWSRTYLWSSITLEMFQINLTTSGSLRHLQVFNPQAISF